MGALSVPRRSFSRLVEHSGTCHSRSETAVRVALQQLFDEVHRLRGDLVVSVVGATPHFLEDEIFVVFTERSDACEHAIDDAAQGPEIGWRPADVVLEQFRADILRSSHESRFVLFLVFLDLVDALVAARIPQLV